MGTIEPGFRSDKAKGWQWEASQVQGVAHHDRLLLAMAWASLVVLCVGVAEAHTRLTQAATRPWRHRLRQVRHARESLFTLGSRARRGWLYRTRTGPLPWHLSDVDALSWEQRWHQEQSLRMIFGAPVRP